ncbi:hypothetical protein BDV19DRAFT_180892 [Aspergillus venezuelensis]
MRRITFPPWALVFCAHPPQPPKMISAPKSSMLVMLHRCWKPNRYSKTLKCVLLKQVVWGGRKYSSSSISMRCSGRCCGYARLIIAVTMGHYICSFSVFLYSTLGPGYGTARARSTSCASGEDNSAHHVEDYSSQVPNPTRWITFVFGARRKPRYDLRGRPPSCLFRCGLCGLSNLSHS